MKITRKWLLVAAMLLSLTAMTTGTLAFLTDRDTATNTFTMGNVDIELEESYKQDSELAPGVEVTKKADIKNIHRSESAYVWLVVSVPSTLDRYIKLGWADGYNGEIAKDADGAPISLYPGFTSYVVKYNGQLAAGDHTGNLLEYVMMDSTVDYQLDETTGTYKYYSVSNGSKTEITMPADEGKLIYVDAYAIQTETFNNVNDAYKAYTNQWAGLDGGESGVVDLYPADAVTVYTAQELQNTINNATKDTTIILDIPGSVNESIVVPQSEQVHITIIGNGETFTGSLLVNGGSSYQEGAGLTIKNVHFSGAELATDACIRLGDGTNTTRYTNNVTISGCTFDIPGEAGVKSYTGGDKNLIVENCTATSNAHSLLQVQNIDGITVQGCTIKSKNGMNFNQSNNVVIDNCTANVKGYAARFGVNQDDLGTTAEKYTISNSTLTTDNTEGDAVVVLRGTSKGATLTIVNTTLNGTTTIDKTAAPDVIVNM